MKKSKTKSSNAEGKLPLCAILKPRKIGSIMLSEVGLSSSSISDMTDEEFDELDAEFQLLLAEVEAATRENDD